MPEPSDNFYSGNMVGTNRFSALAGGLGRIVTVPYAIAPVDDVEPLNGAQPSILRFSLGASWRIVEIPHVIAYAPPDIIPTRVLRYGGGGGGGYSYGGGGAGAEAFETEEILSLLVSYEVTIGALGAGAPPGYARGSMGGDTIFNGRTAAGGPGGGSCGFFQSGGDGVNGGGASACFDSGEGFPAYGIGGEGSSGRDGGDGVYPGGDFLASGGGAGATQEGGTPVNPFRDGGDGGLGLLSDISGEDRYYGDGGGGCGLGPGSSGSGGTGGSGTGGTGSSNGSAPTAASPANRGSGGGGGRVNGAGANGSAGGVIIRYPGIPRYTGGVITTVGDDTVHTFTASGTLEPL